MYGAARQGRFAFRALRSLQSTYTSSTLSRLSPSSCRTITFRSTRISQFSSISQYRQHAVAADMGAEDVSDVQREYATFSELGEVGIVDQRIVDNLVVKRGIDEMTEVQRMTINECLDGADVVAQARTGTGKTLAFLTPIVQRILKDPSLEGRRPNIGDTRALIISPTRELAEQIAAEARKLVYGTRVQVQTAVGGTQKQYHLKLMQRMGCHILVGTPGRINDLLSDRYSGLKLDNIETFVLDEADRLLTIGFSEAIAEIQTYMPPLETKDRQTLMFSATMPKSVVGLVRQTMKPDFKFVRTVDPNESATHETVPQKVVYLPALQNQIPSVTEIAYKAIQAHKQDPHNNKPFKAMIFYSSVNEVRLAYEILKNLGDRGQRGGFFAPHPLSPCKVLEISSQLTQSQRERNTQEFRNSTSAILVASDVAARGMDFPDVTHVIQVGLPRSTEDYIHRLGRTGRAGKSGQGWLILQDDERYEFRSLMRDIHAHNISEDENLETSKLDMTQPSQLSVDAGKIMQFVETGVKSTSMIDKAKAYLTIMGGLVQSQASRSKQAIVDMANDLAKYGWGLETPPRVSSHWVAKMGFQSTNGLNITADMDRDPRQMRGGDRRSRGRYDQDDPFGSGGGKGVFRGGNSEGGFENRRSTGGFGDRRSGGGYNDRRSRY
ncbi:uncharacterized protein PV06_02378 [Exophiala oligosperma]|uniref:ATP-dependent RNA helicase n=1 Tax=Exophiala oligosperma TaxID=215243 RepID=A0A0D2CA50_9EURO|nr:uncharacterized protein PV06_02378 [Exophiala oligosperma]KIW46732.1 hypothetical protein PV06_02378 [Exophiala oligosperma]